MENVRQFSRAALPIDKIIVTEQLSLRRSRPPDYAAENRALLALSRELASQSQSILSKLTDAAMVLCRAHSAGVSILERHEDQTVFRWHSISGQWSHHQGGSLPRHESPCGLVIDDNRPKLMVHPERHFATLADQEPRVEEVLLIPFSFLGEPVGTVWVVSHDASVRFDAEDLRLMNSLATFAAAAYVLRASLESSLEAGMALSQYNAWLKGTKDAATRPHQV